MWRFTARVSAPRAAPRPRGQRADRQRASRRGGTARRRAGRRAVGAPGAASPSPQRPQTREAGLRSSVTSGGRPQCPQKASTAAAVRVDPGRRGARGSRADPPPPRPSASARIGAANRFACLARRRLEHAERLAVRLERALGERARRSRGRCRRGAGRRKSGDRQRAGRAARAVGPARDVVVGHVGAGDDDDVGAKASRTSPRPRDAASPAARKHARARSARRTARGPGRPARRGRARRASRRPRAR